MGLGSLGYNVWHGNWKEAAWDAGGVAVDGLATAVPFIPGGASTFIKAGRTGDRILDGVSAADKAADAVRTADRAKDVAKGVDTPPNSALGGRYGDLDTSGGTMHRHHMPARQASPLDVDDGPAILMSPVDHRRTASYGGGRCSPQQAYRDAQKALIDQGKFDDAFLMDVDDIQKLFPDGRYDDAILEAIDAIPE